MILKINVFVKKVFASWLKSKKNSSFIWFSFTTLLLCSELEKSTVFNLLTKVVGLNGDTAVTGTLFCFHSYES